MWAFLIVLIAVGLILQRLTLRRGFDGISYDIRPSFSTVEPGETFTLITIIKNGTRRFVPFLSLHEMLPKDISILSEGVKTFYMSQMGDTFYLDSKIYLMPRQTLTRRVEVSLPKRGRYFFQGATLSMGDFLGLSEQMEPFRLLKEIVVIPSPLPGDGLAETLGGFLGDMSVLRFIFEDPVLTLGFREYTMREPLKMISWGQSARAGTLMVKNFDYTLELTVTIILNVQCGERADAAILIERCFSLARSVCDVLEDKGIKYDFLTNANAAGAFSIWSSIVEGLGERHYMSIMEGLGRATHQHVDTLETLLDKAARGTQQGRSHILITPMNMPEIAPGLERLEVLSGGRTLVINAEEVG